jgi:hypothetical protein
MGAAGTVLEDSQLKLRDLIDRSSRDSRIGGWAFSFSP